LRTNRNFYLSYPQIQQAPSVELYISELQSNSNLELGAGTTNQQIQQTLSVKSDDHQSPVSHTPPELLINRLSFSHFIELLKFDNLLKRMFYEVEAIKNNWSVRELQRAANSMLFERTGLSTDKAEVLKKLRTGEGLSPAEVFRDPYMLEFLGLAEKAEYSESDLEQAIITHLQNFLLEMGRGFCFEARQKRITFNNTHYKIDLVFYHRLLKCHVLIDLKIGEFSPADAGQMNMYLNYYIDNEIQENDNPPVGIILCAGKNENLVKYATGGLNHKVFVNRYMVNLPDAGQLKKIIEEERQKLI
jgi:predicted nuclease of restriction endonuclease-like (RecB) superfamily